MKKIITSHTWTRQAFMKWFQWSVLQINAFFLLLQYIFPRMNTVILVTGILSVLALILFLPFKGSSIYVYRPPSKRVHEADAVLSRRLLIPGTASYESYYSKHPERKEPDDLSRQSPGLLSSQSRYHQPVTFAAARANFQIIEFLGNMTHGQPAGEAEKGAFTTALPEYLKTTPPDPVKTSRFISRWLKNTGAHSVGFTRLKDHHLYSHKGRGPSSGAPIENNHPNAIAITVEMDHSMMKSAPLGTSVMESSEQYLRSGVLALKLAVFIRGMGYEATAHIDGRYEVVCPLVAVDAGLGTLGRMGLLMTPDLGPRVRISVVTTDLPLLPSDSKSDPTTMHFCHLCKKCVVNCPAAAIPEGPMVKIDGSERWQIDSEKCYHFWTVSGTDCGRCISVCPFGHPDNLFHNFVRRGIKNNLVFRHLAVKLDNVFYGPKPAIRPLPGWTDIMDRP
jgi:ferredoxin